MPVLGLWAPTDSHGLTAGALAAAQGLLPSFRSVPPGCSFCSSEQLCWAGSAAQLGAYLAFYRAGECLCLL